MAKPRHLALATEHPDATADVHEQIVGPRQVRRVVGQPAQGHFLSDGTITIAIRKFKSDQPDRGLDHTSLHHLGLVAEALDRAGQHLEQLGGSCFRPKPAKTTSFCEAKPRGPNSVMIDASDHVWPAGMARGMFEPAHHGRVPPRPG
jgi:hypothetical protein